MLARPATLAALGLAVLFAGLTAWSWGKWGDVQIDWGVELYNAWRISEGDRLYLDLAYRHGPLSPHWNAALFGVFGASMRTLVAANLALLGCITALLFGLILRARGAGAAFLGGTTFLCVFAFGQYVDIGNYNYVTPYLHHQTHGIALALALVAVLARPDLLTSWRASGLAGCLLGGVFLTKLEIFLPAAGVALTGLALARAAPGAETETRGFARSAGAFAAGSLVAPAIFLVLLTLRGDFASASLGLLGNWPYLGDAADDQFYGEILGLDRIAENALAGLRATAGAALAIAMVLACDRGLLRSAPRAGAVIGPVLAVALGGVAATQRGPLSPWLELPRALPVAAGLGVLWLLVARRGKLAPAERGLLLMGLLGLGLLLKMLLHARVQHYGFVIAMPATLFAAVLLVRDLPKRWSPGGSFSRPAFAALVIAFAFVHWRWTDNVYARKTERFEVAGDRMWVEPASRDPRARAIALAVEKLDASMGPEQTLLVLPEGAGLNFWLRRRNPSPYLLFVPTELRAFGGAAAVAEDLRQSAPDFIALLDRPLGEFGVGDFGQTEASGRPILEWVEGEYQRTHRVGEEPFTGGPAFGLELFRRKQPFPSQ